jgi:23S rRNA (guanine2445-N2)-methyltransferase / 23S rRNA (guanine2069-N7)-methyltransferase
MDAFVITQKGSEPVAALDITDILGKASEQHETVVLFKASAEELILLAYRSQAVNRVLILLGRADVNKHLEESAATIKQSLGTLSGADALQQFKGKTFRVNCTRSGEEDYGSQDMAAMLGDIIVAKTGSKVALENPDIIVHAHIWHGQCYVGIDVAGFDLGKRDYKVFSHPSSLTGITAYSAVRLSGYKKGQVLLDPFCGTGTIPIEAALQSAELSPHFFKKEKFNGLNYKDKKKDVKGISGFDYLLRYVIAAKKNGKIAGIEKEITISKVEVEWLDTKVDKGLTDIIVTHPPSPSRVTGEKQMEKIYKEFLYQCEYVLTSTGVIGVVLQNDALFREVLSKESKWVLLSSYSLWQGSQEFRLLVIRLQVIAGNFK